MRIRNWHTCIMKSIVFASTIVKVPYMRAWNWHTCIMRGWLISTTYIECLFWMFYIACKMNRRYYSISSNHIRFFLLCLLFQFPEFTSPVTKTFRSTCNCFSLLAYSLAYHLLCTSRIRLWSEYALPILHLCRETIYGLSSIHVLFPSCLSKFKTCASLQDWCNVARVSDALFAMFRLQMRDDGLHKSLSHKIMFLCIFSILS